MTQHSDTRIPAFPETALALPPLPLASGNALLDSDGRPQRVTSVRVLVTTDGASDPVEITLEPRFGGWWPPETGRERDPEHATESIADHQE